MRQGSKFKYAIQRVPFPLFSSRRLFLNASQILIFVMYADNQKKDTRYLIVIYLLPLSPPSVDYFTRQEMNCFVWEDD